MDSASSNKRIAKNTIMLYIRMLVMMLLSLFTSRIVLQVLGVTDLGITNVVGGIVGLMTMISGSMSLSVQRFLSYDLGRNDINALNVTFSSAMFIHVALALVILLFGETVGLYMLKHYINYPSSRADAVMWVYQMSLISACVSITQIPYSALIIAYEKMGIYAYFTISDVIIRLLSIYLLWITPYDKLIFYSAFGASIGLLMMCVYYVYCKIQFKDVRFDMHLHKETLKCLASFAGWTTFSEFAWVGTNQGVTIVMNIFFGPAVNAARGIATQVQSAVLKFVLAFQTALNPQIIKLYAAGNMAQMQKLVNRGTCFSFYLTLLLSLPVILKADYIINLWLGQVPNYLVVFTQLILINVMLDMLSNLLETVAKAHGQIGRYQMCVGLILGLNFPLTYAALHFGCPAYVSYIVYAFVSLSLLIVRLIIIRNMTSFSMRRFFSDVLFPICKVTVVALPIPVYIACWQDSSFYHLVIVSVSSVVCVISSVWVLGLNRDEKTLINRKLCAALMCIK